VKSSCLCTRTLAMAASLSLVFSPVLQGTVGAAAATVVGSLQPAGAVWVASDAGRWDAVTSVRPMVGGDRLRTGDDGYLMADLGVHGAVAMFSNTEVSTSAPADGMHVEVQAGKLAFRVVQGGDLTIAGPGSLIRSQDQTEAAGAEGYLAVGDDGQTRVAVEKGSLLVQVAGRGRRIEAGQQLTVDRRMMGGTVGQLAAADDADRDKAAGIIRDGATGSKRAATFGTGTIVLTSLVIVGVIAAAAGSGGGGKDNNGSPGAN